MTHRTSKVVVTIRRPFLALLTTIALLATGLVAQSIPAAAAVSSLDGSNAADAAASCWEVKQTHPTSTDGIYWLYTSVMDAPEQFYCDMTTDGGGWVLIGRGREGWRMEYEGLRDPVQVRSTVTGPAAFTAAQLSSSTVDALIGGQDVDELQDGIRLRRATNTAGTTWQEARFNFASRDRWVWTFGARHVTKNVSFDGKAAGNGQTSSFGSDNSFRRVITTSTAAQNWTRGFAFGGSVSGSPASDSYLWSSSAGVGAARPFTQMYLRPRLTSASFDAIPDAGTPAIEQAPLAETKAVPTVWGVSGLATSASELRTEVQSFAQIGDYMYVGGNFANVQRSANDTSPVDQPFLAAFNVNTGQWLSSFRPTLDSQVKALEALPNGQLAVGGEFTQVNGSPASGLVALNPTTGARSSSWTAEVENRLTGGVVSVRSLKSSEDWLYVGGNFTHLGGGSAPGTVYSRGAGRLAAGNGTPDGSWNPNFNGTVTEVEPSTDGSRVYAAGYFTVSNGVPTEKGAALQTSPGAAPIPWTVRHSAVANYQQTVLEAEDRVWLGGSEHNFFSYTTSDLSVASGNITMAGGDFQTSTTGAGVVYGGCHCDDFNYSGSYTWPDPGTGWTQADKIGIVGAWDATTGDYLPEFNPIVKTRSGYGAWASKIDSNGTLWLGGSYQSSVVASGANQWSGGFVRYRARDVDAPSAPANLSLAAGASGLDLSWEGSTDNRASVSYEILQDDRVVAFSQSTSATVPVPEGPSRWFVRAVDSVGNRSASTPVEAFDPSTVPGTATVLEPGADWRWRYDSATLSPSWVTPQFDASSWSQGSAPLGFGSGLVDTVIHTGASSTRPLAAQFRTTFDVQDVGSWGSAQVSVWIDDGAVVYVNGQEVGRGNLPTGTVGQGTYATAAPSTSSASGSPTVFEVPASMLVQGTNTVAVQTHLNYRSTPDASMELGVVLVEEGA